MGISHKTSIRRKQMLIIMLTTSVALLLACATFVSVETISFRKEMVRDLTTLAQIIGNNTAAALDFNDPASAAETLSALQAQPNIIGACVFSKSGHIFAKYERPGGSITFTPPPNPRGAGYSFGKNSLTLFETITSKGDVIGMIYLESNMQALRAKLARYAVITAAIFLLTLLVAFLLSTRLQRLISEPILDLARTASAVARDKNYSMRVVKRSSDEIGVLIDGFNEMLAQIQQRDAALESARGGLELRVAERTAELAKSNEALQAENAERKRAEQELQWKTASRDRLAAILECTTDLVGMADPAGRLIYLNRAGRLLMGVGLDEDITTAAIRDFLPNPDDHPVLTKGMPAAIREGTWRGESTILSRGGLEIPVSQVILTHKNSDGKIEFSSTIIRDTTDLKRAQFQLEDIHKQLVASSRLAGMAEIATNVLHNVGNALNSVNISTDLIADSVQKSKASSLARVVVLLESHAHDLGEFITLDPSGRHLTAHLARLSEHLLAEQAKMAGELDSLRRNVEHIKEIVAMQQNYATVGGVNEKTDLASLVEDGLRLNEGGLSRHGVEIVRELEKTPPMFVQKHKILQILVNLVRNAKYACDESARADKRLTVRLANGHNQVSITVTDNGVGIPPENLTRIFNYGFTTRKGGHGFGLHSSALAAREMGGSLTVFSGGPGQGAAFTLQLPCPAAENAHE